MPLRLPRACHNQKREAGKTIIKLEIGFVARSSLLCYQTFISFALARKQFPKANWNTRNFLLPNKQQHSPASLLAVMSDCGWWKWKYFRVFLLVRRTVKHSQSEMVRRQHENLLLTFEQRNFHNQHFGLSLNQWIYGHKWRCKGFDLFFPTLSRLKSFHKSSVARKILLSLYKRLSS